MKGERRWRGRQGIYFKGPVCCAKKSGFIIQTTGTHCKIVMQEWLTGFVSRSEHLPEVWSTAWKPEGGRNCYDDASEKW